MVINGTNFNDNNTVNGIPFVFRPALSGVVDPFLDQPDTINGLDGNDIINALGTNDTLNGGNGNDTLNGGGGNDTLRGGIGVDRLNGGDGNDNISSDGDGGIYNGDAGNDLMFSGVGLETMNGGSGTDTINHTAWNENYVFNMATGLTNYGGESYLNFENASMGNGNDIVTGNASANVINGGGGNDTISGGLGDDTLRGGIGVDRLNGGDGNDYLYGNAGNDFLYGHDGIDTLNGGVGADTMYGGAGNDTYHVDSMLDKVIEYVGQGTDHVFSSVSTTSKWLPGNVENLTLTGTAYRGEGNDLNNLIIGNASANALNGYGGHDRIMGGSGIDAMDGGAGWDTLEGGAGDDFIDGGTGADIIYGGAGNDRFDFSNTGEEGTDFPGAEIRDFAFGAGNNDSIGLQAQPGEAFATGLAFTGGSGSSLDPAWYFEGSTGNGTGLSGIYLDSTGQDLATAMKGNLWYNPTSGIAGDSQWFAAIEVVGVNNKVADLTASDFVLI